MWNLILLLSVTNAQPEERFYYFNFSGQADWIIQDHGITVDFVDNDNPYGTYCNDWFLNERCLRMRGPAIISRVIPTIGYHTIRIQIDIREYGLEAVDYCYIQYRNNNLVNTQWINKNLVGGFKGLQLNTTFNVFDNATYNNQSSFELRIGNSGQQQHDECFWDDLEVFGIPYTPSPTTDPTKMPSNNPSLSPSNNPSLSPSNDPSVSPTNNPSIQLSIDTYTSTDAMPNPSLSPTNNPTAQPLEDRTAKVKEVNDNTPSPTNAVGSDANTQQNNEMMYITVGCAVGLILVIICIIMGVMKYRKSKKEVYERNVNVINLASTNKENKKSVTDVAGEPEKQKHDDSDINGVSKSKRMHQQIDSINSIDEMFVVKVAATTNPGNITKTNVASNLCLHEDLSSDSQDDIIITPTSNPITAEGRVINTGNYMQWNDEDVLKWILSLNNGVFIQYKEVLQTSLKEENVRGSHLVNVDKSDIKGWGIKDFQHKQTLYDHIKQLLYYNSSPGLV